MFVNTDKNKCRFLTIFTSFPAIFALKFHKEFVFLLTRLETVCFVKEIIHVLMFIFILNLKN